jgi:hypothetical protein
VGSEIEDAWRTMPYEDRVDVVEMLLRNRAMMLDPEGRPMPGVSIFGVAPTDEEFRERAREIVDVTGVDQRAAVTQIDAFGDEVGQKMLRAVEELARSVGVDPQDLDDGLPPPPEAKLPPPERPQEWSARGPVEERKDSRSRKDEASRARLLKQSKDLLRQGDEFIANAKAEMARNTDFEKGLVQLPSASYIFAVGNRDRIVEIIADLEQGVPLSVVKKKMRRLDKDARSWRRMARKHNV